MKRDLFIPPKNYKNQKHVGQQNNDNDNKNLAQLNAKKSFYHAIVQWKFHDMSSFILKMLHIIIKK